jgi:hypothetical protein
MLKDVGRTGDCHFATRPTGRLFCFNSIWNKVTFSSRLITELHCLNSFSNAGPELVARAMR